MRILSYNIHHGEGIDGRLDLERIARVIREAEPDLVALQEVDDRAKRTGGVNQSAELGRLTGMVASFGQAMLFQGGGYGQTLLSRWPIQTKTVYSLPQQPGREPRIAMAGQIKAGPQGGNFLFVTTHLDHEVGAIRLAQAERLGSLLRTNPLPIILAGDFNAGPDSDTLKVFSTNWIDAAADHPQPTIPAEKPVRRIDYILLHPGSGWRVVEARVLDEPMASDHRPILATVEWAGGMAK